MYFPCLHSTLYVRRKFRSQTSDNMDRWKSRGGKSQRREEKKKEDQGRERVRRQKIQVREKVAKSRNTAFCQWSARSEARKVGSLKAAGAETSGQMGCRKSARCCGAKPISKSTCTKNTRLGPLLEVAMSKKCTSLWREAHLQVKQLKTLHVRTTFGSWDVEKVHAVVP